MAATSTSPAHPKVPTRRISFEERLAGVPRHFAADGDLVASHLTAVLSAVFPDGEDFFVRSVRHFRSDVTDPTLKRDVGGFIGQEAVHGREHRSLNDHLATLGYRTKQIERGVRWGLRLRERIASPRHNLATTAALEHFTATFAEVLLGDTILRSELHDPVLVDIFSWHALEECEHKAVAFDVYQHVFADDPKAERTRVQAMNQITATFIVGIGLNTLVSLLGDRETYRRGRLRASLRRARQNPMVSRWVWRRLRDYNRLDFHPDDHDTGELCARWRVELFGDGASDDGRLSGLLAGAA
ncbi:MAG: metal-dependent hydrolase [Acidimicrobiales bacterium]